MLKNFVIIGVGGYIAERHLRAIKDTHNNLLAALDKHDSVGILDTYFPETAFFTEFERFDRHIEKIKRQGTQIHYVVVCSPNYLHDAHIRFGLRIKADVICEKPLVLNPWNVDALMELANETQQKVYTVLQLRLHPTIVNLRQQILQAPTNKMFTVNLQYITPRGNWYHNSWKGQVEKSGGIATNIGIHFFDILIWIFGAVQHNKVHVHTPTKASGQITLQRATVNWALSIDKQDLPLENYAATKSVRVLEVDGEQIDFSQGFENLHTQFYEQLLLNTATEMTEVKPLIALLANIRNQVNE